MATRSSILAWRIPWYSPWGHKKSNRTERLSVSLWEVDVIICLICPIRGENLKRNSSSPETTPTQNKTKKEKKRTEKEQFSVLF